MRGLFTLIVLLVMALLFTPTVSMCGQACVELAIQPLEPMLQSPAMANQDAQVVTGAMEFDGTITHNVPESFTAKGVETEVSAVALSYKPVADQDRSDSIPLDKMNALVNVNDYRFHVTVLREPRRPIDATDQNEHSTHLRPVRYHQRV